jgi:ketosteroid isomerase-like protein
MPDRTTKQRQLIEDLFVAVARGDATAAGNLYAEDAVSRRAGVPRHLGGVVEGRAAITADIARRPPSMLEVRQVFDDGENVCAVVKRTGLVTATQTFRGSDREFTTYECVLFKLDEGRIKEQTTYVNWLDAYVQAELIDLTPLLD